MPATYFDEFWLYPEILGQLSLLVKGKKALGVFTKLIEDGDTEAIEGWLTDASRDDMVERLFRLGIPNEDSSCPLLFDEILLGTRSFQDGAGTVDYVLSRRVGPKFHHRVYNDGPGDVMYEFQTDAPMAKEQFEELTTYPAPWEESGFDDQIADSSVWSVWDEPKRRKPKAAMPTTQTPEEMLDTVKRLQSEGRMPSLDQLLSAMQGAIEEVAEQPTKKRKKK